MFTFTNYSIYDAMGTRYNNGVKVFGVLEGQQDYNRSAYDYFQAHNIPVYYDNFNSGNGSYLHDKVLIIDDSIVLTGSYNYTLAADTSNDESFVIVHSPEIASLYKNEFIQRYNETGHTYDIRESRKAIITKNATDLLNTREFLSIYKKHKGFVFRLDGRIIHNPYTFKGIALYKDKKVWKRALITK